MHLVFAMLTWTKLTCCATEGKKMRCFNQIDTSIKSNNTNNSELLQLQTISCWHLISNNCKSIKLYYK